MTVDDDSSCECFPPQMPFELTTDQPGLVAPRSPPFPVALPPVTPAPPPPPPPVIYTNPPGPQDNPHRPGLTLVCPGDVTVHTDDPTGVPVTYPPILATSGCPPPSVSVSPPNGSKFPVGVSPVLVNAVDPCARRASCSFNVKVVLDSCPTPPSFPTIGLGGATGATIMSFDPIARKIYIGCTDASIQVISTKTNTLLASYTGGGFIPHGSFSLSFDYLNKILFIADQSSFWSTLDLSSPGVGIWTIRLALAAGYDAGNVRMTATDGAHGIAMLSGINNGSNGAIHIVQSSSGPTISTVYASGYTLPILGENPCFSVAKDQFVVTKVGGTPSFYYVNKLTGALTASALNLGPLLGQCFSIDALGLVAFQDNVGKLILVDPVADAVVFHSAITSGSVAQSLGYNSCTKKLYLGYGTNNGTTDTYDLSSGYVFTGNIPVGYTAQQFDPLSGLMYGVTGGNQVTTF